MIKKFKPENNTDNVDLTFFDIHPFVFQVNSYTVCFQNDCKVSMKVFNLT